VSLLRELIRRLAILLRRREFDADLEEEMRLHLELRQQENVSAGMSDDEARYAASRRFGNATYLREESRSAWGWAWLENAGQDLRYAVRVLRKSSAFCAVAILTIAFGIGATTAIFSIVDATLLHPLPYPDPEQLVTVQDDLPGVGARDVGLSQPELQDLQRSGIFDYVSPAWFDENNLTGASQPARVRILIVAPNYFALLGVRPQLGRTFNPNDSSPGLLDEVVISDGLWKRSFAADPHILGKTIRMDTDVYRIVGVMPPGFDSPGRTAQERNIEIWPASSFYGQPMLDHPPRAGRNLPTAIARLKPGLTLTVAQSRLDSLIAALHKEYPQDYPAQQAWTVRLIPLHEKLVGNVRHSLILLFCAVTLVLLIVCVNVANLLLARASARSREIAVRQALGAARYRLICQLLTESLLLSFTGALFALAVLYAAKQFLVRLVPASFPHLNAISINWTVLLFALGVSLLTGAIFGLAPALHAGRADLVDALKPSTRGATGSGQQARTRRLLVVAEFALSLVLMIAAGLLLRSFWDLLSVRLGFDPQNVMTFRTRLPYPNDLKADRYGTPAQQALFIRELVHRTKFLPGVFEAALGDTAAIPLDSSQHELKLLGEGQFIFYLEGRDTEGYPPSVADRTSITPGYSRLLGIPLHRGRMFGGEDTDTAPSVAIVNECFARTFFPNDDPVGKRFRRARVNPPSNSPWTTIIGVLADARTESLAQSSSPKIYFDLYQTGSKHLAIFLSGHLDPAALPAQVREQIQSVDPTLPVFDAQTLPDTVSASLAERRFSLQIVALFALTALLLAALGIYGVISYLVAERTHEIGIRIAFGAEKGSILRMVLRQGLRLALAGAALGLIGALIVSRLMSNLLFDVRPTDPATFLGVALLLVLVALAACYIPARRAIRVDPILALRHE
jgi:putative ABC transport system permease protein